MLQDSPYLLQAQHLVCGYEGKVIVQGVHLALEPASLTGIIGPNGAGKSTTFKTLMGLLPPLGGEIWLRGRTLSSYRLRERAQQLAMVNQLIVPAPLTVYEYVLMGRMPYLAPLQFSYSEMDHRISTHYLERMQISGLRERRLDSLSGGEQQLAALAQALTQQPKVLLLDEPTSHLDIGYTVQIMQLLRELMVEEQLAVLMIIHDLNVASEYCDTLLLIGPEGTLVQGPPEEVITPNHIRDAYGLRAAVAPNPHSGRPYVFPLEMEEGKSALLR